MIQTKEFLKSVEKEVKKYACEVYPNANIEDLEVIQVWYCKTIQNHKGLFIVKNNKYGFIYEYFIEATYNGDKEELYLDFYKKTFKQILSLKN